MTERMAAPSLAQQEHTIPEHRATYPAGNDFAIEAKDLVKRYPKAKSNAIDGISFVVRRGEIFGLLGPNGAGKTTTISILTTGARPSSGTAKIMGIDVTANPVRVKQHIAVVPQNNNLDKRLHARELLTFHASYHTVPRAEREARADRLLAELGLTEHGKDNVNSFSGGMAQRLMLARALMHVPDVLFLDEPTNSLDPQSRLFLWDCIRELNQQGITILLTTHDMDEAEQLCDRIAIMDKGSILVLDTTDALKKLIPEGNRIELSVQVPESVSLDTPQGKDQSTVSLRDCVVDALRALPNVTKVEEVSQPQDEEDQQGRLLFRLYAANEEAIAAVAAKAIQAITSSGALLDDLRLARPSLEDVFISLTGRNLRS